MPPQEPFELFETLRWEGGYPLLERHLARLANSAAYFGFPFEAARAATKLLEAARDFESGQVYRVRLLLCRRGDLRLEAAPFHDATPRPLRVAFARQPTDSRDRFLYHKTTRRGRYDRATRLAREQGLADLLFVNEHGEVTEGAVNNLFIERAGVLYTPPLRCGLLPGVYRRHHLDTQPRAKEQALRPHDLESADALYLCNALRGLRRVTLDSHFPS